MNEGTNRGKESSKVVKEKRKVTEVQSAGKEHEKKNHWRVDYEIRKT